MSPSIVVVFLALAWLAMFAALGSGPAWLLGRGLGPRLILAPVLGVAIGSAVLTSVSFVLPMGTAAYAVLLPMMVASVVTAVLAARKERPPRDAGETLIPVVVSGAALLLALVPAIFKGSLGPFTWVLRDAWWHVQSAYRLQDHTVRGSIADDTFLTDLVGGSAWLSLEHTARIGITAFYAGGTELLGRPPDETLTSLLAALLAVIPCAVWIVTRLIGGSRVAAGLAAAVVPLLALNLAPDAALGNLTALIFIPMVVALAGRAATHRDWRAGAIAGIAAAGLLPSYPELVPYLVVVLFVAAAVGIVAVLASEPKSLGRRLRGSVTPLAVGLGMTLLLAPHGAWRMFDYLRSVQESGPSFVERGLAADTFSSWLFGLRSIYELEFRQAPPLGSFGDVAATWLPVALALCIVAGVLYRHRAMRIAVVVVPSILSLLLGYYVFKTGAVGGDCQYCLNKQLTPALPFIAVGLGLGLDALWRLSSRRGAPAVAGSVGIGLLALGVVGMLFTAGRITRDLGKNAAFISEELREVASAPPPAIPDGAGVFLEGVEDTGDAVAYFPAFYHLVKNIPGARPYFDIGWQQPTGLYVLQHPSYFARLGPPTEYANPGYHYVLTAYGGISPGRTTLRQAGRYAVEKRAPIDVIVARSNQIIGGRDRRPGLQTGPSFGRPFELWVSSPRAGKGHIVATATAPLRGQLPRFQTSDVAINPVWRPAEPVWDTNARFCLDLNLVDGFTLARLEPYGRLNTSIEMKSVEAGEGPCAEVPGSWGLALPGARFTRGSSHLEPSWFDGEGARWLRGNSSFVVGTRGLGRPAVEVSFRSAAFQDARVVVARIGSRAVARARVGTNVDRPDVVRVRVPGGQGVIRVDLATTPGDYPASRVNPDDPRHIAVLAGLLSVRPVP